MTSKAESTRRSRGAQVAVALEGSLAVVAAQGPASPSPGDSGRVAAATARTWIAGVNRGDLECAAAVVARDAVFDVGGLRYRGRTAVRGWIRSDLLAGRRRYTVVRVRSESRAALFDLSFRAGSPREEVRYRFATLDRRIQTLTARYR
jgi:SnoaL-like domain